MIRRMCDEPEFSGDGDPVWIALADPGKNLGPVIALLRDHCGLNMSEVQEVLKDPEKPFFCEVVRVIRDLDARFDQAGAQIKVVPDPQ